MFWYQKAYILYLDRIGTFLLKQTLWGGVEGYTKQNVHYYIWSDDVMPSLVCYSLTLKMIT